MEQAKKLLYDKVIKRYTFEELIHHRSFKIKNLVELLSRYPSHGMRFKVWRKTWPEGYYYEIRKIHSKGPSLAKLHGIKYAKGERKSQIEPIGGMLKRGLWRYEAQDYTHRADNGMYYNDYEMKQKLEKRDEMLKRRAELKKERTEIREEAAEES